jgi:hypothetical protein
MQQQPAQHQPDHPAAEPAGRGGTPPAVRSVQRLATAARALAIASALAALGVLVLVGFAVAASLDAMLRFPMPVRVILLAVIAVLVAIDLRRFVLPALRFRPSAVELALRVERKRPELSGRLASAVEFEESGLARRSALAARAVADLEERARGMDLRGVLRVRPAIARVGAVLALAAAGVLFAAFEANSASIAARRIFLPWTDAAWPARTAIEGLIASDGVLPRGKPVALRARLTKGDAVRERVFARYRVWPVDGSEGPAPAWNEVALSRQPSGDFERLVDADGGRIEVVFLSSDAETELLGIRLVEPPRIVRAAATITAPDYARSVLGERTEDLGDGRDARGTPRGSILEKSEVVIDFELSRELPLLETESSFVSCSRMRRASRSTSSISTGFGRPIPACSRSMRSTTVLRARRLSSRCRTSRSSPTHGSSCGPRDGMTSSFATRESRSRCASEAVRRRACSSRSARSCPGRTVRHRSSARSMSRGSRRSRVTRWCFAPSRRISSWVCRWTGLCVNGLAARSACFGS